MGHLAVYGHVNVDYISQLRDMPKPDTTVEIEDRSMYFGGTAGNIAAVAASLGAKVALAGFIGYDFPQRYHDHLVNLGIDVSHLVVKSEYGTPTWWGFTDPQHRVLGIMDQGPMRDLENFEILTGPLESAEAVHFATGRPGYYARVADLAMQADFVPKAFFDPGQELLHIYEDRDVEAMLERTQVAFFNEQEAQQALQKLGYGSIEQMFDHELEAVLVTKGAKGVDVHTDHETIHVPSVPIPSKLVKDTTGAGDAFRGGFHAARQRGQPMDACVRYGIGAAAFVIQQIGCQSNLPEHDDVTQLVERIETA